MGCVHDWIMPGHIRPAQVVGKHNNLHNFLDFAEIFDYYEIFGYYSFMILSLENASLSAVIVGSSKEKRI